MGMAGGGLRAYAYVRVSTREQDEEAQRRAIEEFCRARGIEVAGWFVDRGESGAKRFEERPEAARLLDAVKEGGCRAVVVFAIDRLGRSMYDTVETVRRLEEAGVRVLSVREEFLQTLDEGVRKLLLSILAWVAEQERRRIRERQEAAWAAGKQKGRPRKLKSETIEKYLKRYPMLPLTAIQALIAQQEGITVHYETLRKTVRELGYARVPDPRTGRLLWTRHF
ncbi:MAG: recombinase family protein [Thermofilaceae archaeon]